MITTDFEKLVHVIGTRSVYLATPYTDPKALIMERRTERANDLTGRLMEKGVIVFNPIGQGVAAERALGRAIDPKLHYEHGLRMVDAMDMTVVMMQPGWEKSHEVKNDVRRAQAADKEVIYYGDWT